MKNPIVHFEIPADDCDRAIDFYTRTFGWEIQKMDMPADSSTGGDPYYAVRTTEVDENNMIKKPGAINGGLMKRKEKGQPFTNYISVESIDEKLEEIKKNGGTVCLEKTEIMKDMGWIAAFLDTEGNMMGLHEFSAKMKEEEKE